MVLAFPRDLVFEAYLGRWVDITALPEGRSLRQVDPVAITWGLPNEQSKALAPPSTVDGALNNTGGHWTPGNPMSDYYAYLLGRNVPTRLGLRVSRDTYTRTVPVDWGFSDTSDGWNTATSGSGTAAVGSGVGTHTQPNAAAYVITYLGDSYPDCQTAITGSWNLNVAGGAIEPVNLVQRYQPSGAFAGEHYLLRVSVSPAEVLTVAIFHSTLGLISSTVTVATLTPGANSYRGKFQIEGQTLRGKVYVAGPGNDPDQFEPLGWHVSAHHERLTGGFPGVRTGVAAGNTNLPVTVSYDGWDLRLLGHSGELANLAPTWDESHRIKKARFKCADITQRLGRPQRPALSSAPRRYLTSNAEFTTTDVWPLDESATAPAQGLNLVAGGESARFERTAGLPDLGGVQWGETDQVLTSVPGFATVSNQGGLRFPARQTQLGSAFAVGWVMRLSPDEGAQVFISTAAFTNRFVFFFYTDGTWELFGNPGSVTLQTGTFDVRAGLGGAWLPMTFTTYPSGGNTVFRITANGINQGGGTTGIAAYSPLRDLLFYAPGAPAGGVTGAALSSVFVTPTPLDTITTLVDGRLGVLGEKVAAVLKGWPGERALARAFRLCAEEGVPFDYWGEFNTTPPMGPQRPIPLLDQLQECAEADQSVLYGPRYTAGVAIRSRRSMCARPAVATLSYSSGHIARELAPSADDRPTANLVRAERINGGFVIVEQTAGPMNTKDPGTDPDAVGKSPAEAPVNAESDASLPHVGGWVRALGTTPEVRFPRVTVNLRAPELTTGPDPTLPARSVLQLTVGDRLLIQGLTAADIYRDLDQIVRGGREVFTNVRQHQVTLNTAPYEKFRTGVWSDGLTRHDTVDSSFVGALTTVTSGAVSVAVVGPLWDTRAALYPLNVECEGEVITISAASGASSPQTLTISGRSVNGVIKSHPAGAKFRLATAYYHG